MIVLDAMDLEAGRTVHGAVHERHWRQEGKHHGWVVYLLAADNCPTPKTR